MIIKLINLLIVLILPFLMLGIIKKTKAFWGGRKGASIFQPLSDFIKLLKKGFVVSETTSFVFNISPVVNFTAVLFAALFVPLAGEKAIINIPLGLIVFAYILALGKFFSLICAMDTGSSFEGMGASREACFTTITEPAFFMTVVSIMALSGNFAFDGLKNILYTQNGSFGILILFFSLVVLFIMILVEGSRIPVDDPATHLELTMIHEVMILDNSGLDLALFTFSSGLKMLLLSSLMAYLIIPCGISGILSVVLYLVIISVISILIGTIESSMARIRMSHLFEFIFIMSSLSLVILSLALTGKFGS